MSKAFFTGLLLFFFSGSAFSQYGYWQQKVDYQMEIDMDVEKDQFTGKQRLKYWNNSPNTLDKVYYHLYYNAFQPGSVMDIRSRTIEDPDRRVGSRINELQADEIGYHKINKLTQDGKELKFKVVGTILEVELNKALKPNSSSVFEMEFESQVPLQVRRTGRDTDEGIRYSMTQWYPKMAEYDYTGWNADPYIGREFHGVWGDFDIKITIDSSYIIGGTGYLQNPQEIGHGYLKENEKLKRKAGDKLTWHFKAPRVHDFAFAADPDYTHTQTKLNDETTLHFFFQKDSTTTYWDSLPHYTKLIFEEMNKNFGKYPYKQYTVIQGGDGGMEYPMTTLITGNRSKGSLIGVTAHEVVHSWYQHLLATNESLYPWMDEGFTSFADDYILQNILPNYTPFEGSYRSYFALAESGQQEPLSTHADHYRTNWAYAVASYSMGSIFINQLGYIIGEEVMLQGMRNYFNQWKYKHPTPNDFLQVMEQTSGLELNWYLREWTQTTNTIDYGIKNVSENEGNTNVLLVRKGDIPMPLDIKVVKKDGSSHYFIIPLEIMRGEKRAEEGMDNFHTNEDWPWVYPFYELELPMSISEIKSIEIDPSRRMADVDRENNVYPVDYGNIIFRSKK